VFFCGVLFYEDSFRDIVREKKKGNLSMTRVIYQAENVTKTYWSFCQLSSKNRWVKPTWAMTHDSPCNECQDKRTRNIMRYFAGSVRRPWENVVWSHMKKCGVEPRCGCESHIYMTWRVRQLDSICDETTTDFLGFLAEWIEKKPSLFAASYEEVQWWFTWRMVEAFKFMEEFCWINIKCYF
jgi:hypothetical protein